MRLYPEECEQLGAYPGVYSGSIILYPKALKVKPIGVADKTEDESSDIETQKKIQ